MPLATLSIDLEARLAKFDADLGKAQRSIDKLADGANSSLKRIGEFAAGTSIGDAISSAISKIVEAFPRLIEGVARFQDLSEETNASAEGLAAFRTAADVSGVEVEQLAGLMVKLTTSTSKVTTETAGARLALKNLGIDYKAFRELRPDQQIDQLARTFDKFGDSQEKTNSAIALMGRGGAAVLRFFKEYVAEGGSVVRITDEQIKAADDYSDAQAKARSQLRQTVEAIAVSALPALTALTGATHELASGFVSAGKAGRNLSTENAILTWAENGAIAVGTVVEALIGMIKLTRAIGGSFQAVAADIALPFKVAAAAAGSEGLSVNDRARGVLKALSDRNATVKEANERYVDLWTFNGTAVTDAIRKSFAEQRRLLGPEGQAELAAARDAAAKAEAAKPKLSPFSVPSSEEKQAAREFAALIEQIRERTAAATDELATGQKLNEVEQFSLNIRSKLGKETSNLSDAQRSEVETLLTTFVAVGKANAAQLESIKLRQADARQVAQDVSTREKANRSLAEENAAIGLTTEQLEKLHIKRLEVTLALQQERIATVELFNSRGDDLGQMQDVADAIAEELRLRRQAVTIKKQLEGDSSRGQQQATDELIKSIEDKAGTAKRVTGELFGALEQDLTESLRKGELTARRFADVVIDELLRINVVKPALAWLAGGGAGSAFSALIGFITGSAKGNAWSGGVKAFGSGGIFGSGGGIMDRPTFFGTGNGIGIGGEAGTEGVLPLRRGRDGKLGVIASGGGGAVVNNTFNVGAGVSRPEVMSMLQAWGANLKSEILSSMRNGGAFSRG